MKKFIFLVFLLTMVPGSSLLAIASPGDSDTTVSRSSWPESLRVTIDPGEFRWHHFCYEAELRVSPFPVPKMTAKIPERLTIYIDRDTPGTTFWVKSDAEDKKFARSDYLVLHRDQVQVKGRLRWRINSSAKVTVRTGTLSKTVDTEVSFPMFLLLICMLGGAAGGWLRRIRDTKSVVPVRLFSKKWSQRLLPVHESLVSMVAGVLLYLLNLVSPVYLGFRTGLEEGWLTLVQPLLIGFIGGWGGINLLVHSLNQFFRSTEPREAAGSLSETKSNKK